MKNQIKVFLLSGIIFSMIGCGKSEIKPPRQNIKIIQNWEAPAGTTVGKATVVSAIGEVGIKPNKKEVIAPYSGTIFKDQSGWIAYESAQFPGHLIKIAGLKDVKEGSIKKNEVIGKAEGIVNISLLQNQGQDKKDNKTVFGIIEMSKSDLEKMFP